MCACLVRNCMMKDKPSCTLDAPWTQVMRKCLRRRGYNGQIFSFKVYIPVRLLEKIRVCVKYKLPFRQKCLANEITDNRKIMDDVSFLANVTILSNSICRKTYSNESLKNRSTFRGICS